MIVFTATNTSTLSKIQEEMSDLHSLSIHEKQHIQSVVEKNRSIVDDSCLALETEVSSSSQALEKTIASVVAATIPASATITPLVTETLEEPTPITVVDTAAFEGSSKVDVKVESSPVAPMSPSTIPLEHHSSKPTNQTLEARKPALSDISNRQGKCRKRAVYVYS